MYVIWKSANTKPFPVVTESDNLVSVVIENQTEVVDKQNERIKRSPLENQESEVSQFDLSESREPLFLPVPLVSYRLYNAEDSDRDIEDTDCMRLKL